LPFLSIKATSIEGEILPTPNIRSTRANFICFYGIHKTGFIIVSSGFEAYPKCPK
jgi:hypothetical protein